MRSLSPGSVSVCRCSIAMKTTVCFLVFGCILLPQLILCANENSQSNEKTSTTSVTKRLGEENAVLSVVKSLVELASNGFKTGFEASVRSLFNKPATTAMYALSMLVGVVAMLAFYESPISPMPVPPLPDPPVGRFPPEHPVWPPKNQAPNGGGVYQQRASMPVSHQIPIGMQMLPSGSFNLMSPSGDNHRSDKHTGYSMIRGKSGQIHEPGQLNINETSYNTYLSKLTADLLKNGLNTNGGHQRSNFEQLKQVYNTNSDLSNKVIDYNNKRMTVESLKYNNNNQTIS